MNKTLNKDGTPRKKGSGKTKGAGCYASITWSELKNLISDDVQIPVSRVWLRNLGEENQGKAALNPPHIAADLLPVSANLTASKYKQPKESKISTDSKFITLQKTTPRISLPPKKEVSQIPFSLALARRLDMDNEEKEDAQD